MIRQSCVLLTFSVLLGMSSIADAARIEADPSKKYELTRNQGPWMISVATFHTSDPNGVTQSGKSPEEAAHDLIIELRKLGMPAYVYVHDPEQQRVTVTDRIGREEVRKNLRRVRTVLVLAGNYQNIDDKIAQDSLKWIKKISPKSLQEGVKFVPTKARPTPLSGAFLTLNPLLSPEEVTQNKTDPLLLRLNSGENHSLYENNGKYTLVIARFYGKQVYSNDEGPDLKKFLKNVTLDDAAIAARELATVLRGKYDKENKFNNIDAYVWHDRHESIVTVGSFTSPNDPAVERYKKLFGPRLQDLPDGRSNYQPGFFGIQGFGKKRDETRLWVFEPNPQLMAVPQPR